MKMSMFRVVEALRTSYWFIPSIMVVAAVGLGALVVWVDAGPGTGWLDGIAWYNKAKPEGAREVLATIAGSMITVAGVSFSITIVAIAYAASQYGPRILTNFMSNRGNQLTLGTFIATFVYCVVVLRTVQSGDSEFVPQLAVMIALLLALCSVGVLIYFIHHIPQSIHVNSVVASIGRHLLDAIDRTFPDSFGERLLQRHSAGDAAGREVEDRFTRGRGVTTIGSARNGYIQAIDEDGQLQIACKYGLVLRLQRLPGDFVHKGQSLALAWPAERIGKDAAKDFLGTVSIAGQRTPAQDIFFLIDELVEIAGRALSTGINDPYTAISCLDWLGAGAAEMVRRRPPSRYRDDEKGDVRIITDPLTLDVQVERGFGRVRPYIARDKNAAAHCLETLGSLAEDCLSREQIELFSEQVEKLVEMSRTELEGPALDHVKQAAVATRVKFSQALERLNRSSDPA